MAKDIIDEIAALLQGRQILIVDDQRLSRHIVARFFAGTACAEVLEGRDGSEGLKLLVEKSQQIGAVICDFNMPGMNGLQVLQAVRTGFSDIRNDLPVIMLTGNSDGNLVGAALALDVDAFVVKPVSKNTLLMRLRRVLSTKRNVKSPAECRLVDVDAALRAINGLPEPEEAPAKPVGTATPLGKVKAGSVLAQDLRTPSGELLLAAGVALTQRLLDRLIELNELGLVSISTIWIH